MAKYLDKKYLSCFSEKKMSTRKGMGLFLPSKLKNIQIWDLEKDF